MHDGRSVSLNSLKARNSRMSVTPETSATRQNDESVAPSASVSSYPHALSDEQFRPLGTEVVKFLSGHLSRLPDVPIKPHHQRKTLPVSPLDTPPENGSSLSELLEIVRRATETCYNQTRGGFMAYVPGGGLVTAAIADLVAAVINPYT